MARHPLTNNNVQGKAIHPGSTRDNEKDNEDNSYCEPTD